MKVHGRQVLHLDIEVSETEIMEHAITLVRRTFQLSSDDFLRNDEVRYDDPDHRHGSIQELVRRKATETDKKAFALIDDLQKIKIVVASGERVKNG